MRFFIFFWMAIAIFFACKNETKSAPDTQENALRAKNGEALPADFLEFYQKFHADSAFQMEHISWPMDGEKLMQVDTTGFQTEKITWTPEDWRLHRLPDLQNGIFEIEFTKMGENMVMEVVFSRKIEVRQERRFAKIAGDDWKMIFYSEM